MKTYFAFCVFVLPLALTAPIQTADGIGDTSQPAIGAMPRSAIFSFISSSRARQLLIDCDTMLLEKKAYLADRWSSSSLSSLLPTKGQDNLESKSPILPDHLPTPALRKQLGALLSTSTSTTSPASSIVVSLHHSRPVVSAYANRIRLEDIITSRDLPAFLGWLSARPIMAWTLIVAVLIIVFFVSAIIVEIAVALRKAIISSDFKRRPQPLDSEQFDSGEIYLPGPEKKLAAVIFINEAEKNIP